MMQHFISYKFQDVVYMSLGVEVDSVWVCPVNVTESYNVKICQMNLIVQVSKI